jgi:hypothetical protein
MKPVIDGTPRKSRHILYSMHNESFQFYDDEEDESLSDDDSFFADPANKKRFSEFRDILSKSDSLQCMRKKNKTKKTSPLRELQQKAHETRVVKMTKPSSIEKIDSILRMNDSFDRIQGRGNRVVKSHPLKSAPKEPSALIERSRKGQHKATADPFKNPPVTKMTSLQNDELIERFLSASSIKLASLLTPKSRSKEFILPVNRKREGSFPDIQRRA